MIKLDEPAGISDRKQLFIDRHLVAGATNVSFTMNPPYQTGEALLTADRPWEMAGGLGLGYTNNSVLQEDGLIRVWYDSLGPDFRQIGYAESRDGVHFTKPDLGVVDAR